LKNIFENRGLEVREYRYFDKDKKQLNIKGMLEDLRNAPEGSFIELQMCGHNPTGCDPNMEEWKQIAEICKERKLRPIFDTTF
jgi:aspartate/tyrosine/aromatic aminotransferase